MGGVQSLSKGFVDEFTSFDGPSKVKGLKDLIKLTAYPQQLEVLEYLREILFKDFIACLPPNLAKKIICYLPYADILSCLLVNKKWNDVVTRCDAYWEWFSRRLGLCSLTFRENMVRQCGSLKALCVAGFKQCSRIRALVPATVSVSKGKPTCTYVYAGNGVLLKYREINGSAEVVVEKARSHTSLSQVASFLVSARSGRIKWAAASDRYLMWKQVDGKWIGCSTEEKGEGDLRRGLDQWDDEPAGEGFFSSIAFCHRCHLVTMMADAEGDCEVWDVHVVKLQRGALSSQRVVYPVSVGCFKQPPAAPGPGGAAQDESGPAVRRFCLGGKIMVVSECEERDGTGFCTTHLVLLQVGNCVAIHRLKSVSSEDNYPLAVHALQPEACLSKPICILSPHHHHRRHGGDESEGSGVESDGGGRGQLDNLLYTQPTCCGAVFCMSHDRRLLGIVYGDSLHVWNLGTCEREVCTRLVGYEHHSDTRCVALGAVYAVLASDVHGVCTIVTTHNGEVVLEYRVREQAQGFVPEQVASARFSFYAPLHEEWLSAFGCLYPDAWPLALFFDWEDGPIRGVEFKAILGSPRGSKSKPVSP